ncbi:hypothetical protein Sango_0810100 [Sesamum angolense]|uniref:Uncharacterized protein n=1 Tax=Sesamum angolense TaxID=2727404 RepID=A0AAE1X376_9LAMI|nr:hypothetical protein Sango_0810100 [Sesamum angolense]
MVMCRDFNEILEHAEKEGGPMRAKWQIRNFRNCLSECELHDLGFQGTSFTWCNNQHEPNTAVAIKQLLKRQSKFRFEASWFQEADCEKLVTRGWKSPVGSPSDNVLKDKISMISTILSCWGKMTRKDITKRIKELENTLVLLQQNAVNEETKARGLKAKDELTKLISQEEIFWKQQSKDLWLYPDGSWTDSVEGVQQCIVNYFQKIFSSNRPLYDDIQWGIKALPVMVDTSMAETLQLPLTEDEISFGTTGRTNEFINWPGIKCAQANWTVDLVFSIWKRLICRYGKKAALASPFLTGMVEDCEVTQQIPFSISLHPDLLVWHYSSNGLFSVKSTYHLALSADSPVLNKAFLLPEQVLDFARSYLFAFESACSSQMPRGSLQRHDYGTGYGGSRLFRGLLVLAISSNPQKRSYDYCKNSCGEGGNQISSTPILATGNLEADCLAKLALNLKRNASVIPS